MVELTLVETILLAALSEQPGYGYDVVQRMSDLTDGRLQVRPGNLYRVLDRLMERGLVLETGAVAEEDPRRRYFRASASGRRAAAEQLSMYSRVLKRAPALKELLSDA
jgi:DNA-binding PadR family transcriptional regulator